MENKLKKTDCLFLLCLAAGLSYLAVFIFTYPYLYDESFYATVPYRFINGDNIMQHDWHLTQFSSLFTYLPVKIWLSIKGSADGIIIFLRSVYLFIHTAIAITIYRFFREYKAWAIAAAMIFLMQSPYRILAISYHSVFSVSVLFFTLCLISIYQKPDIKKYILAGVCYGCCCVCNPFFCAVFPLYLLCCASQTKREAFQEKATEIKEAFSVSLTKSKQKKKKNKKKKKKKKTVIPVFPSMESYTCFFNKKAIIFSSAGLLIVFVITVIFFFAQGGSILSTIKNLSAILESSEHKAVSSSVFSKISQTFSYFNIISFKLPFLLPIFCLTMVIDRKRCDTEHRLVYIIFSLAISIMYIFGILRNSSSFSCCILTLPFAIISITCYILTQEKNKLLFRCMYLPSVLGILFQYLAANTHLSAIGITLAISNIAGVIFVRDLCREISVEPPLKYRNLGRRLLCIGMCIQFAFSIYVTQYGQIPERNSQKSDTGPYSGLYMNATQYEHYCNAIHDLDIIKDRSNKDSPVLIVSYQNWMYLYIDRPVASFSTWYQGSLRQESLVDYYQINPEKIPKYIYVDYSDYHFISNDNDFNINMTVLNNLFEFKTEELSDGLLLSVTGIKFN